MMLSRALLVLFATAFLGFAALAQRAPLYDTPAETRAALQRALAERDEAEKRSARLELEAKNAADAAEKTARETAALAARIQQAEAGIAAAEARIALVEDQREALREDLGARQEPLVHFTAALQQFSRRPVALSLLRPGEIHDVVYLRAVMDATVPQVRQRTAGLRRQIAQARQLQQDSEQAAALLRKEEETLEQRHTELAGIEARQRLAARQAGGIADREAERALALGEEARDLDALVGELDRAGALRRKLAALPGPVLRPADPASSVAALEPLPAPTEAVRIGAPAPYILPVAGRIVTGFGAPLGAGISQGVTLAPRANAQVVAPGAGRVAFAGPYRGYGRIVIIEHGGGWTSLVTGLARIDVSVGDQLVGGAPLGIAGPGNPAITLELRREGEPVNPVDQTG